MSPGCTAIWEYNEEELKGDPNLLWDAVIEEDLPAMRSSVMNSKDELTLWYHRYQIITKSGARKCLQAYGAPHATDEGTVYWHTIILDVTVEVEAQKALENSARLLAETQRFETVGRLAGGVAHDFNNLLAVVLGNADAIDRSRLSDEAIVSLNEITSAADAGSALTKQLLSFARQSPLLPQPVDVGPAVQSIVELAERIAPARIEFECRLPEQQPFFAKVDKVLLETALLNLLLNAQEAIEGTGMIVVEVSSYQNDQAQLTGLGTGAFVEHFFLISVQDTGCGIAKDDLERIFEPFFTTKDLSEGSGLGLAMVDGFAEQSGGRVRVTSTPGKGSTFDLILPLITSESPEEVEIANPDSKSTRDCRILLVEDNPSVLRVLQDILDDECASVTSTVSGDEALEVFLQRPEDFDVIVTDVVMPGSLQGLALVRAVRNIRADIAAVFLSGYPYEAALQGTKPSDQDGFLMKPARKQALIKAINKALQRTKAAESTE